MERANGKMIGFAETPVFAHNTCDRATARATKQRTPLQLSPRTTANERPRRHGRALAWPMRRASLGDQRRGEGARDFLRRAREPVSCARLSLQLCSARV